MILKASSALNAPPLFSRKLLMAAVLFGTIALTTAAIFAASPAAAQDSGAGNFDRPYGTNYGDESRPFEAGTRDANGNRVIINGRIVVSDNLSSLPPGLYNSNGLDSGGSGFSGAGVATGNQLNVVTSGSYNTVIVNSTQVNNGNQTVNLFGGRTPSTTNSATAANAATSATAQALNGGINLDGF